MNLKIYWFRKDLRIEDNVALLNFSQSNFENSKFLFLYIKNKNSFKYFGEKRVRFLYESLSELKNHLKQFGINLFIADGNSFEIFSLLSKEFSEIEVYANDQVEPYAKERDRRIKRIKNIELKLFNDSTIFKPGEIVKDDGTPYTVYTPFSKKFLSQLTDDRYKNFKSDLLNVDTKIEYIPKIFNEVDCEFEISKLNENSSLRGGRKEGIILLKEFYENKISNYKTKRDFPGVKGTSNLSPYIHFGVIGIRECFRTAISKMSKADLSDKEEIEVWIKELIWREFYYNITYHFPYIDKQSFKKNYDKLNWRYDDESFIKWCSGKTGYPIVDAGMRQLKADGWMHNRVRMIVAMFLTKDLFIDWRWGEKYFAEHLIDLDFSSNNGGWQWSASTGCDAQPYFRIFNPVLQSKKFDPEGIYIKKYVEELRDLSVKYIHSPWEMPKDEQESSGFKIGKDYPLPIVNHLEAKNIVLEEFKRISVN